MRTTFFVALLFIWMGKLFRHLHNSIIMRMQVRWRIGGQSGLGGSFYSN